jgi:hypothetical protein
MKKNYKQKHIQLLAGLAMIAVCSSGTTAFADDAANIEAGGTGPVTYDNYSGSYPVISMILSQPGVVGTHTYTSWAFFANDGTGSLDIFATKTALTTLGYTPTVGDGIAVSGTYSPFDQIPEVETITAISGGQAPAAALPTPTVVTIPTVNVPVLPLPSIGGQLLQLNNVTIGGTGGVGGLFPTYAQATTATETFTVSDGTHSMTLFDWVTSYSTDGLMGGTAVPTGPVNIEGFVDVFGTGTAASAEFIPMIITPVATPEPSVLSLLGVAGSVGLVYSRRFGRKA